MRSDVLVVAEPGRRPRIECRGGIAVRCTDVATVHLVSAAVTPLGGDNIAIRVIVSPGAVLRLRSVAATIVLPGIESAESSAEWDVEVGGDLDIDCEPTVVAAHARHTSDLRVRLTDDARLRIRERIQIGRNGEREGFWTGTLTADLSDGPLLRHRLEMGRGALADDVLGNPLAGISELRYPEPAADAAGMTLDLARGGSLSTWQGERLYS